MKFFASSFNSWAEKAPWHEQAGCILTLMSPLFVALGIGGSLLYAAYWWGTKQ